MISVYIYIIFGIGWQVCSFVKLSELYYAGSHGMDIKGPAARGRKYKKVRATVLKVL